MNTISAKDEMLPSRPPPKRKFYARASQACEMCRQKKMKCDQGQPCQTCKDRDFDCRYTEKRRRRRTETTSPRPDTKVFRWEDSDVQTDDSDHSEDQSPDTLRDSGAEKDDDQEIFLSSRAGESQMDEEMVGARNKHTTGTEFYGNSSNFALLNQLFSRARKISAGQASSSLKKDQTPSSLVDMFYDDQVNIPDPVPPTPVTAAGRRGQSQTEQKVMAGARISPSSTRPGDGNPTVRFLHQRSDSWDCFIGRPMRLEMEYVNLYFENVHTSQPFLNKEDFVYRCERHVWAKSSLKRLRRDQMHFLSLYNAVLAVASLTAGKDALKSFRQDLENDSTTISPGSAPRPAPSNLVLSKLYFSRARRLLGDMFEVCSIDSAQALLLMSIYSQHALKPHACYMYSGMATRTAMAIGLSIDSRLRSEKCSLTASRTWWTIYAQDIKSSCASGRSSTLSEPSEYPLVYPQIMEESSDSEGLGPITCQEAIITVRVESSDILRRALKQLYHRSKSLSMEERSQIAIQLDRDLVAWRARLPAHLNPDLEAFNEPEWATKQKLTLQLHFYNTRMFIHRSLFSDSARKAHCDHMRICLEASHKIITLLYDAYQHRYYFRTWWSNSVYALYASLILLYAILLDYSDIPADQLIRDVQKALKILHAMTDMKVARRCADLIAEILNVTNGYVESRERRRDRNFAPVNREPDTSTFAHPVNDSNSIGTTEIPPQSQPQEQVETFSPGLTPEGLYSTRDDILACLGDPGILECFAIDVGNPYYMNFDQVGTEDAWRGNVGSNDEMHLNFDDL